MIDKKELLEKFKSGVLSTEESNVLEKMFINDSLKIEEFEIYNTFDTHIENEELNISLDHKIQNLISEEIDKENLKQQKKHWFTFLPLPIKLAFPLMLLLCGFFAGKSFQVQNIPSFVDNSTQQMGNIQMVNDLLYHPSSSQRLTLVNNANNISDNQEQIIRLLFMSLNHDKSANVRMAAVDALMLHSDKPFVREGLIRAISQQESTLMTKYITEALSIIGEKVIDQNLKENTDILSIDKIKPFHKKIY